MNVQSVNSNLCSMCFGANVKFLNPNHADTIYSTRAKKLLDKVKEMSPDTDVIISYIKTNSPDSSFIVAKNGKTGVQIREHLTKEDYGKDFNDLTHSIGVSDTFCNLLKTILYPYYLIYNDFWYGEKQFEPSFGTDTSKTFVA